MLVQTEPPLDDSAGYTLTVAELERLGVCKSHLACSAAPAGSWLRCATDHSTQHPQSTAASVVKRCMTASSMYAALTPMLPLLLFAPHIAVVCM